MKSQILALVAAVAFTGAPLITSQAEPLQNKLELNAALHAMEQNAYAARQNAEIYQWARVNREVDRIIADGNKVEKALATSPFLEKRLYSIGQAIRAMRSARLAHDVDRMKETTAQVIAACTDLEQK